jgi:hypothetical protein
VTIRTVGNGLLLIEESLIWSHLKKKNTKLTLEIGLMKCYFIFKFLFVLLCSNENPTALCIHTEELDHTTCSQSHEEEGKFFLKGDFRFDCCRLSLQRDFAKVFLGWKDYRIDEELPLRQYISAEYNNKIAKKYNKKLFD